MRSPMHLLALSLAVAVLAAARAGLGAELVLHVDPARAGAADANDGGEAAPLATIGEAVRRALAEDAAHDAAAIIVHPGLYRESVRLEVGGNAPHLRLTSAVPGGAVISGAEPLGGWTRIGPNLFRAPWTEPMEKSVPPAEWPGDLNIGEPALRREMLFVNGQAVRQVYDQVSPDPGTFLADEGRGALYLRPPPGSDPTSVPVEVARRDVLLSVANGRGVVVEGFTVERAASPMMTSAVTVSDSDDVTLRGLTIRDNNGGGLAVGRSSRVVLEDIGILRNGSTGMGIWQVRGLDMRGTLVSGNNWRGAAGRFLDWAVAGAKLLQIHDGRVEGLRALDNAAPGLWLDTDIAGLVVRGAELAGNHGPGLVIEAAQGPVSIHASRIVGNGEGVAAAGAERVVMTDTVVACNRRGQLVVTGAQDRPVTDHHSGAVTVVNNRDWRLSGNVIAADRKQSPLVSTTLPQSHWDAFLGTLRSEENLWRHSDSPDPFRGPWGIGTAFDAWRDRVGESGSRFEAALAEPCADAARPD